MTGPIISLILITSGAEGGADAEHHWNMFELVSSFINFFLFFGFLFVVVKGPFASYLAARRSEFQKKLEEAESKQKAAEAKLVEYAHKLEHLEEEMARIVKSFEAQGEVERDRIKDDADRAIDRLVREVDFTIRQESLKAQQEIRATAIKTTLDLAESLVKERTTQADLVRLTDECVAQIGKPSLPS
ncbi:MAG: ATP synthase F0 subunit B [Deltaproteobacteria bacterium]|nr:ATP synthase F0 subunit B [Deltaproteobacteria bacterium]